MYIFQANGSKVIREEMEMYKIGNIYHPVNESEKISLIFLTNNPTKDELDTLIPFGNNKYIMFSEDGDILKYIDKLTECRKKELQYLELQVESLKNRIAEENFEAIIVDK